MNRTRVHLDIAGKKNEKERKERELSGSRFQRRKRVDVKNSKWDRIKRMTNRGRRDSDIMIGRVENGVDVRRIKFVMRSRERDSGEDEKEDEKEQRKNMKRMKEWIVREARRAVRQGVRRGRG